MRGRFWRLPLTPCCLHSGRPFSQTPLAGAAVVFFISIVFCLFSLFNAQRVLPLYVLYVWLFIMPRCAVADCTTFMKKGKTGRDGSHLSFHRFPVDKSEREDWIVRCRRADPFDPDSERVCSDHFLTTDLEPSCVVKLSLGVAARPALRRGVVPTQHLPSTNTG